MVTRSCWRRLAGVAICGIMALPTSAASASPWPGTMPGEAGTTIQAAMAFMVYGSMAAAIVAGLVGARRL